MNPRMTGPKPVALPAWLHPSVTKISLKVEILQCVAISSHVFLLERIRHPEGGGTGTGTDGRGPGPVPAVGRKQRAV